MFSGRTGWDGEVTALARAAAERRGLPLLDLTAANPTRCGFAVDAEALLAPLSSAGALRYEPEPFGLRLAREAVSRYYAGHGATVDPADLCLTTSTSEAYSFLFRLLCDPGDEVLIATPSYPLLDYLAALDDVRLIPYPLVYEHGWQIQPEALANRIGPRTRAIALVHPNNPTGHFASASERAMMEDACARHGLALLVDEVFLDYPWPGVEAPRSFANGPHPALTLVLSGVSKVAALPQMKLGWLALSGPAHLRTEARARLEIIADTFLSVSAPVQHALPAWLAQCGGMQEQIRQRTGANLLRLDQLLAGTAVSRLVGEGGWYAVLRIPAIVPDEEFALRLLAHAGVLVHGGSAFGMPPAGWLVVSLLPDPPSFERGVLLILEEVAQEVAQEVALRYG